LEWLLLLKLLILLLGLEHRVLKLLEIHTLLLKIGLNILELLVLKLILKLLLLLHHRIILLEIAKFIILVILLEPLVVLVHHGLLVEVVVREAVLVVIKIHLQYSHDMLGLFNFNGFKLFK